MAATSTCTTDDKDSKDSKELKCDDNSGPVTEFKVGTEDNQHVVADRAGRCRQRIDLRSRLCPHPRQERRNLRSGLAKTSTAKARWTTNEMPANEVLRDTSCSSRFQHFAFSAPLRQWDTFCDTFRDDSFLLISNGTTLLQVRTNRGTGPPFCPHCSAPQIRVIIAEPAPPLSHLPRPPRRKTLPSSRRRSLPVLACPCSGRSAFKPCALAALVASILMYLGLNPFVAMLSVGFLAVVFYRQRRPGILVKPMVGAGLAR